MNNPEIEEMASLEMEHWWYRGLRHMIERTLGRPEFRLPRQANVLDAGCGTGANLNLLYQLLNPAYAGGFDISPRAVELCRTKVAAAADVYLSDIRDPEIHIDRLNLILSCDVVSIAGISQSKCGMRQLVARLVSGGLLILNLPAFQWLQSSHDALMNTRERTTAGQVRVLLQELGLRVELLSYRLWCLFPAVVAARMPTMLRPPPPQNARSDLKPVKRRTNAALTAIMRAENSAICSGIRMPWGSSIYAVARKP